MWTSLSAEVSALSGMPAEELTRRRLASVALRRREQPEDLASVIGFLASSRAGYMTGRAISVDGGLIMHQAVAVDRPRGGPGAGGPALSDGLRGGAPRWPIRRGPADRRR